MDAMSTLLQVHKYGFNRSIPDAELTPEYRAQAMLDACASMGIEFEAYEALGVMARTGMFKVVPSADADERYRRAYALAETMIQR